MVLAQKLVDDSPPSDEALTRLDPIFDASNAVVAIVGDARVIVPALRARGLSPETRYLPLR
jgi:hypothetical protein